MSNTSRAHANCQDKSDNCANFASTDATMSMLLSEICARFDFQYNVMGLDDAAVASFESVTAGPLLLSHPKYLVMFGHAVLKKRRTYAHVCRIFG